MSQQCPDSYVKEEWQQAQIELLLKFDEFCQEHGLEYSLDYGSMIGAVRHRGYVPWDNDIDVSMVQSEYDKLVELARAGTLPEGYVLMDPDLDPDYMEAFGRLVDTRSTCMLTRTGWTTMTNGVFIDIFAFRPLPDDPKKAQRALTDFLMFDEYLSTVWRRAGHRTKQFKRRYQEIRIRSKLFGRPAALEWIRNKAKKWLSDSDTEWVFVNSGGVYNGFPPRKREWVSSTVRVPYGGYMLPIYSGYLDILRVDYGDSWRYWPEDDMRFIPYPANLNIPGEFLAKECFRVMDKKESIKFMKDLKNLAMKDMLLRYDFSGQSYRAKGLLSLCRIKNDLADIDFEQFHRRHGESGDAVIEDARRIASAFDAYYTTQTGERYRYWRVAIEIDPNWLASALWALLITRKDYWTAAKILELCHQDETMDPVVKASEPLTLVEKTLSAISDMHLAMDKQDDQSVEENLRFVQDTCPEAYEARIGAIWVASRKNPDSVGSEQFERDFSMCSDNGEYLAYWADALEAQGQKDQADELRTKAMDLTHNGMALLWMKDRMAE